MSRFIKNNREYIRTFCLGLLVIIAILLTERIIYDDKTLLISDAFAQYYDFFTYLHQIFWEGRSPFYSLAIGGGMGMVATIAYYLISPFNIIALIFPQSLLQFSMHIIIVLKVATIFLTEFIFLRDEHKKANYWILFAFTCCYALSSFTMGYLFHILWLDALYLLPLVALGVKRLVSNNKPLLFGISIFLSVMCNYYMGYMICIFSIIYFIYRVSIEKMDKSDKYKRCSSFLITLLCFGLMSFFVMYPTLLVMIDTGRGSGNLLFDINLASISSLGKYFIGFSDSNPLNKEYLFLYCGLMIPMFNILYLFNSKVSSKEKKWVFIVEHIFILSFFFKPLYYAWHVFSIPACFYGRFSYLFIFFLVSIACKQFDKKDGTTKEGYLAAASFVMILAAIFVVLDLDILNYYSIYGTVLGSLFYLFLVYLYSTNKDDRSVKILNIIFVLIVVAELFFNGNYILRNFRPLSYKQLNDIGAYVSKIGLELIEDDDFYRYNRNINNSSAFENVHNGANGTSIFVSTTGNKMLYFLNINGINKLSNCAFTTANDTPFTDSVLNIKYFGYDKSIPFYDELGIEKVPSGSGILYGILDRDFYILKNNNTFGVATSISNNQYECDTDTSLGYQNCLYHIMTGSDNDIFSEVYRGDSLEFSFDNSAKYYYVNFKNDSEDIKFYVNNELYYSFYNNSCYTEYLLVHDVDGEKINIRIDMDGTLEKDVVVYSFDYDEFVRGFSALKERSMSDVEWKDSGYIKGKINISDGFENVLVSIPYENGWSAYVDGEKTQINNFSGLMSINMSVGEHEVEMVYKTPGFVTGYIISAISLIGYVFYYHRRNRIDKVGSNILEKYNNSIKRMLIHIMCFIVEIYGFICCVQYGVNSISSLVIGWIIGIVLLNVLDNKFKYKNSDEFILNIFKYNYLYFSNILVEWMIFYYLFSRNVNFTLLVMVFIIMIIHFVVRLCKLFITGRYGVEK